MTRRPQHRKIVWRRSLWFKIIRNLPKIFTTAKAMKIEKRNKSKMCKYSGHEIGVSPKTILGIKCEWKSGSQL